MNHSSWIDSRKKAVEIVLLSLLIPLMTCRSRFEGEGEVRKYVVEEIERDAIVQLYCDEFEGLTPREKEFAYYLYMASIVGRDINFDQHHRDALKIKMLLEGIVSSREGLKEKLYKKILKYATLFWINNGQYDEHTNGKILPEFSSEELKEAALWAFQAGALPGVDSEEELYSMLDDLDRVIFDPEYEAFLTNRNPGPGQDMITGSANNLYRGVSMNEVAALEEKFQLNSRIEKIGNETVEQVYRAGGEGVPPGLYAEELSLIIGYLEKALPLASPGQDETLEYLIHYFKTGDPEYREKADVSWVKTDPRVDLILGFIEVYLDPRAVKGEFEALVTVRDEEMTKLTRSLADNAQYFEDRAPWVDYYKRKEVKPPIATAVMVLVGTGDAGPVCMGGVNLPNGQAFREKYGSKSIMLTNVLESVRAARGSKLIEEFSFDENEKELKRKFSNQAGNLLVAMHEVLGHGSGKVSENLTKDPSFYIKEYYNTLEEARADLVALWHAWDEKVIQLGLIEDAKVAEAMYRNYVTRDLSGLAAVPGGDRYEEDHHRARHMIVSYLMEKGAVERMEKEGKSYLVVDDIHRMREGVGELLAELMRIKAEGDYSAIKELVDGYGTYIDTKLRDEVLERVRRINLPNRFPCIMPRIAPVLNEAGSIVDVSISYPMDFPAQMMEFAGMK